MKDTIESEIDAIKRYVKEPASKNFWGFEHQFDFEYGWHIGYLEALIFASFLKMRNKIPDRDEEFEIKQTIASRSQEIKKLLSKKI